MQWLFYFLVGYFSIQILRTMYSCIEFPHAHWRTIAKRKRKLIISVTFLILLFIGWYLFLPLI